MDADRFDALSRSLITAGSRRRALIGLLGGTLGLAGARAEEAAAKNCKKIKNKAKRKKCLAKTRAPGCTPQCAGKTCGDDGCGGSCGDCFRGSCQGGVCVCPSGEEVCKGACTVTCDKNELRDPDTCQCCGANWTPCALGNQCCSGLCNSIGGPALECKGRNGLEDCTWNEQCRSGVCEAGKCTCDGEICGGICRVPCSPERSVRHPTTCLCCLRNGIQSICPSGCSCCCSGTCSLGKCTGLGPNEACTFDAQCQSEQCLFNLGPEGGRSCL